MRIGRYLISTQDRGMTYTPDPTKGIEVYVDADFAGGWDPGDARNAENVYSQTGYVIRYAGCPIYWQSKLQMEIALSMAEAEYIALSQALRETLPMTSLMKEINVIFPLYLPSPRFVIKVREDNQSCIAMAQNPKLSSRTKHIAIKYHHFRKHVITQSNPNGFLDIDYCSTDDQIADIFTKPVRDDIFMRLRQMLLGW
jgi:KUP system potassium uptake protein